MTPEQFELLVRVDERQTHIIDMMKEHLDMDRETHDDQRKRIESLEASRSRQKGMIAGISLAVSGGTALLVKFWNGGA
jgi:hypothetical protein